MKRQNLIGYGLSRRGAQTGARGTGNLRSPAATRVRRAACSLRPAAAAAAQDAGDVGASLSSLLADWRVQPAAAWRSSRPLAVCQPLARAHLRHTTSSSSLSLCCLIVVIATDSVLLISDQPSQTFADFNRLLLVATAAVATRQRLSVVGRDVTPSSLMPRSFLVRKCGAARRLQLIGEELRDCQYSELESCCQSDESTCTTDAADYIASARHQFTQLGDGKRDTVDN